MAKRKHQFHCNTCNSPCDIFKKGKAHRVFVCPQCGILATNPFSLKGALKGGAKGAIGSIPIAGGAILGALEGGSEGKQAAAPRAAACTSDRFTTEERVRMALHSR